MTGSATVTVRALLTAAISGPSTACFNTTATVNFSGTPNAVITYKINGGSDLTVTLNGSGTASVATGTLNSVTTYSLVSVQYATAPACVQSASGSLVITPTALIASS